MTYIILLMNWKCGITTRERTNNSTTSCTTFTRDPKEQDQQEHVATAATKSAIKREIRQEWGEPK